MHYEGPYPGRYDCIHILNNYLIAYMHCNIVICCFSNLSSVRRIRSARASLEAANRVLSMFVTSSSTTTDVSMSPRHPSAAPRYIFNQSPKNRHTTLSQLSTDSGTLAGDRETLQTSSEVDGSSKKTQKSKTKRKGLDRSSTFKSRGEDKKEKDRGGSSEAVDSASHQQLVTCALGMRDCLEEILVRNDTQLMQLKGLYVYTVYVHVHVRTEC